MVDIQLLELLEGEERKEFLDRIREKGLAAMHGGAP
jgi:hypothetical protein